MTAEEDIRAFVVRTGVSHSKHGEAESSKIQLQSVIKQDGNESMPRRVTGREQ